MREIRKHEQIELKNNRITVDTGGTEDRALTQSSNPRNLVKSCVEQRTPQVYSKSEKILVRFIDERSLILKKISGMEIEDIIFVVDYVDVSRAKKVPCNTTCQMTRNIWLWAGNDDDQKRFSPVHDKLGGPECTHICVRIKQLSPCEIKGEFPLKGPRLKEEYYDDMDCANDGTSWVDYTKNGGDFMINRTTRGEGPIRNAMVMPLKVLDDPRKGVFDCTTDLDSDSDHGPRTTDRVRIKLSYQTPRTTDRVRHHRQKTQSAIFIHGSSLRQNVGPRTESDIKTTLSNARTTDRVRGLSPSPSPWWYQTAPY
ncbi:hypothetical protein LXL04_021995 [Taraxacum kok-saghyz]